MTLISKKKLKAHLFICTNIKPNGKSCGPQGSQQLRDVVKDHFRQVPEAKGVLRVNSSGCLGACEEGIACVLYPEGKWFTRLSASDSELLVRELQTTLKEPGNQE